MIAFLFAAALAGPQSCDGSQSQMNECAAGFYKRADQEMNIQWRRTLQALERNDRNLKSWPSYNGSAPASLVQAQRAWLTYREQTCQTVRHLDAGTITPFQYYVCMFDLTKARVGELRALSMNPEHPDEPL